MARLARIILPNIPHHIVQRGNRRQRTFFDDADYQVYLRNLSEVSSATGVTVECFCLMPNHVHLLLIPPSREALITCVSELHQRYTRYLNFKMEWRGHLWQGRFFSVALDQQHFETCRYYIWQNPIRAGLIKPEQEYPWRSHGLDFKLKTRDHDFDLIRKMTRTGRPNGTEEFMNKVFKETGIDARPKRPGRKPKERHGCPSSD